MKHFLILLLLSLGTYSCIAQNTVQSNTITIATVPEPVQKAFANEFPHLQARWEKDAKNYKAIYADPKSNSKGIILYDADGKVVRRDTEVNTTLNPE